jgi:hypothetical protein
VFLVVVDVIQPQRERIGLGDPAEHHLAKREQVSQRVVRIRGDGAAVDAHAEPGHQSQAHGVLGHVGDVGENHITGPVRVEHGGPSAVGTGITQFAPQVQAPRNRVVTADDRLPLDQ